MLSLECTGGFPAWKLVWTGALAMSLTARPAHALRLRKKRTKDNPPHLDVLLDQSWPILKNLGFSGVLGVMAALAFKVSFSRALRMLECSSGTLDGMYLEWRFLQHLTRKKLEGRGGGKTGVVLVFWPVVFAEWED